VLGKFLVGELDQIVLLLPQHMAGTFLLDEELFSLAEGRHLVQLLEFRHAASDVQHGTLLVHQPGRPLLAHQTQSDAVHEGQVGRLGLAVRLRVLHVYDVYRPQPFVHVIHLVTSHSSFKYSFLLLKLQFQI